MTSKKSKKEYTPTSSNDMNKLRAAVLGANDGVVSTAGIVLGVAGAAATKEAIIIAGAAGLVSGAISMAAGEFVSVSSQRDTERAFLKARRKHIKKEHDSATEELIEIYQSKGMSEKTAKLAAYELEQKDLVNKELEKESGIDPDDITNPWSAAIASATAFTAGSAIPLASIILASDEQRVWVTAIAVIVSLALTGTISARVGKANKTRAALRVVVWGIGAMIITYAIGSLIGMSI